MGEAIKVKEQDRTCYCTCTCGPWDRSQPPQLKNTQSSPSSVGMASMNAVRASCLETGAGDLYVVSHRQSVVVSIPQSSYGTDTSFTHVMASQVAKSLLWNHHIRFEFSMYTF